MFQSRQSALLQSFAQDCRSAHGIQHAHGGDVQRVCQSEPVTHRAVATTVIIQGREDAGRSGKFYRHIGHDAPKCRASLKGDQVGEWLEGRTRRARCHRSIDLAIVSGEIIVGAYECQHVAGMIFEDDDRSVVGTLIAESCELIAQRPLHEIIQRQVKRGVDDGLG